MTTTHPNITEVVERVEACPCCQGEAAERQEPTFAATLEWRISCKSCGVSVQKKTRAACLAVWNTRAARSERPAVESDVRELVETLTEAMQVLLANNCFTERYYNCLTRIGTAIGKLDREGNGE